MNLASIWLALGRELPSLPPYPTPPPSQSGEGGRGKGGAGSGGDSALLWGSPRPGAGPPRVFSGPAGGLRQLRRGSLSLPRLRVQFCSTRQNPEAEGMVGGGGAVRESGVTEIGEKWERAERGRRMDQAEDSAFQGAFPTSLQSIPPAPHGREAGDEIQMWPCPLAFQPTKPSAGPDSHFRNGSCQAWGWKEGPGYLS